MGTHRSGCALPLVRDRRSVAGWYAGLLQGHCLRHGIGPDEAERLVVDNWGDCKAVLDGRMTVSELLNCQHGTPMISPCERCAELERLTGKGAA